jgi:23S rRNA pseudouridine955/2504/2580 synthase
MNAAVPKGQDLVSDTFPRGADVRSVTIDEGHAGQRLDNYLLGTLKGVPQSRIYRLIRRGEIRVDGRRVTAEHRLAFGARVRIPPVRTASEPSPAYVPGFEFPIVYEDEALLVIDKPIGVAVHGGSGVRFGVIEQLRAARPEASYLELVHRIDRETSGLLLIAKKRMALLALQEAMRQGQVQKRYRAVGWGHWHGPARAVRFPLVKLTGPDGERLVVVREGGQYASTKVRALAHGVHPLAGPISLLEADLETGRTHQIRVHLAHLGYPLVGDPKYGNFALNKQIGRQAVFRRMFLHAFQMSFKHPSHGQVLRVQAPMPDAFTFLMERRDATI